MGLERAKTSDRHKACYLDLQSTPTMAIRKRKRIWSIVLGTLEVQVCMGRGVMFKPFYDSYTGSVVNKNRQISDLTNLSRPPIMVELADRAR